MANYIYLFRHAQTYYNKRHIFTGWKDSRLTELGKKQAEKIAKKLRHKRIDIAFHSGLSRSRDTLMVVLKYHPECKIVVSDPRIMERSYGVYEGTSKLKYAKKHGQEQYDKMHRGYNYPIPKGETIKDVEKRIIPFIKDLLKIIKENKVNVAVSAHGNSMRPFRRYFEHLTIKQMMQLENPWDDYFEYKIE